MYVGLVGMARDARWTSASIYGRQTGKLRGVVVVRMRCGWLVVGVSEHERRVRNVRNSSGK